MYKLKEEYKLTEKEKDQIQVLNDEFYKNDHELLHTSKKVNNTIEKQIDALYFKYLRPLENLTWYNPYEEELNDLIKNDHICGKNHNKKLWVKAYMLAWFVELNEVLTEDFLFNILMSRRPYNFIIKNIYEKI